MKRLDMTGPWPGAPVYFKRRTTSTMEDARRLFLAGCPEGTVVLAGFQEKGRGRLGGRLWTAAPGKNLLFTLVLRSETGRIDAAVQRLPLLAGLALALAVERLYGLSPQLKWPNDLLVDGKKLAGILCEALSEGGSLGVLIGIGLNCNQAVFPQELEQKASSLLRLLGREVPLEDTLRELLKALKECLGDENWRAKVVERLWGLGREVSLYPPQAQHHERLRGRRGLIRGINPDGSLLFQALGSSETAAVYSGEFRVWQTDHPAGEAAGPDGGPESPEPPGRML
jgi:BirA family biotin operon repressor/biotin-[acetyl-CoA-carboxylase] ligase